MYTNYSGGNLVLKHNNIKFDVVRPERTTHHKVYPNQLERLKRAEQLHRLKLQFIFSEAS